MSTIAFVQARMGSTRLPGKVLAPVGDRPLLARVVERVRRAGRIDEVVVATSDLAADEPIRAWATDTHTPWFAGSSDDVLDRYHRAAEQFAAELVVRVTADCPLVDPEVVDRLIERFRTDRLDHAAVATGAFAAETGLRRFADGLDAEVLAAQTLAQAWSEAVDRFEREHVTPFVWRRPDRFALGALEAEEDFGHERWTVDFAEDLEFVRAIFERLGNDAFGYREVLELLRREPALRRINAEHGPTVFRD